MIYKLIIFLFLVIPSIDSTTYLVVGVHDGDTVTLLSEDKWPLKVRLEGIDAPELGQPFGKKSKQFLSDLCYNKNITLKSSGKDKYGRTLGWIYTDDGKCVNIEMINAGLAWHYKKYSHDEKLSNAENQARQKQINIWSDKSPVAPWDYRHPKNKLNSK